MKFICIDNTSKREELIIGNYYELFKHEQHPKVVWVKIPDISNSVGYRTIQCYLSDFINQSQWRDIQLEKLFS